MMLTREEVTHVLEIWGQTDTEDFERMLADYMPQGMYSELSTHILDSVLPRFGSDSVKIAGSFMAGLELGWLLAEEAYKR